MKKVFLTVILILICIVFYQGAEAAIIIDTGPGLSQPGGAPVFNNGAGDYQWTGVRFDLTKSYIITDAYGWIFYNDDSGSSVALAINFYGNTNGGNSPDLGNELFSGITNISPDSDPDWSGLSGLSLALNPGSYWLTFEMEDEGSVEMPQGAPDPNDQIVSTAVNNDDTAGWVIWDVTEDGDGGDGGLGVQVYGNEVVPEPATMGLLLMGLLGLGGVKFRKIKK